MATAKRWVWLWALSFGLSAWGQGSGEASVDGGAAAEEAPDDSQTTSQVASFAVTKLKDSPAVVTVITSEDIKNFGARDLIDILYMVPGFFFGLDTQGVVGPGFRGLWGYEGKILLIIDGKEMNELLYSTTQLGNEFPAELIERVEVVRGPGSVIYGGSAELAVINVVTRGLQGGTDLMVSGTYSQLPGGKDFGDSYGRRGITLSGRYVSETIEGLSAFASGSIGQGQRSVRNYVAADGTVATMEGASHLDPAIVQAGIAYRNIQATFLYARYATTAISGAGDTVSGAPVVGNFDNLHGEITGTFHPTDRFDITPRFNVLWQQPWTTPDLTSPFYYDKVVSRFRGRLIARWAPIDELQITLGGDAIFDHAHLSGPEVGLQTSFAGAPTVDYQTVGGFIELYSENPIVNVVAGARYDYNSQVGGSLVPRVVLLRSFGPVSLKALFSMSFRSPGIENFNLEPEGAVLKPERTTVFEFEGGWDITKQIRFSANLFDMGIQSPIAYNIDPVTNVEGYQNLGKQGSRGFELALKGKFSWVKAEVNYSFYTPSVTDNIDTYLAPSPTDPNVKQTNTFLGAPAHRLMAMATFKPTSWFFISPSILFLSERLTVTTDMDGNEIPQTIPAQALCNLYLRVEDVPVKGLSFGLGFYNIFGTAYKFPQPYDNLAPPLPGLDREILLKITYLFEPG